MGPCALVPGAREVFRLKWPRWAVRAVARLSSRRLVAGRTAPHFPHSRMRVLTARLPRDRFAAVFVTR